MTSPGEVASVFTSPYLSAGAPALGEAKGLMLFSFSQRFSFILLFSLFKFKFLLYILFIKSFILLLLLIALIFELYHLLIYFYYKKITY